MFAESERRSRLALMTVVGASAALINPAGWRLYSVVLGHAVESAGLGRLIMEWQPPSMTESWLVPFWALLIAAFAAMVRGRLGRRAPLEHAAAVVVFGLAASRHVRVAPYFVAVAAPAAAAALGYSRGSRRAYQGAAAALLAFFALKVLPEARGLPFIPRYAPEGIARFFERESPALLGHRLFHPVEWGGFLGYRIGERFPVFADGRYLFHPMLEEIDAARASPEAFRRFLDRYRIDLVVLRPDARRVPMLVDLPGKKKLLERPSYLFFLPKADWAMVYWDADGMVFVRRADAPADWLGRHEYRLFRPDDLEAAELMVQAGFADARALDAERSRWLAERRP